MSSSTYNKVVRIMRFPDKSTPLIQPLDVYGFRQWKLFVKNFSEHCLLYGLDDDIHQRNNVLILYSIVLNQLQSPKFTPMWLYSWHASNFIQVEKRAFKNVDEICFSFDQSHCDQKVMNEDCDQVPFSQCSYPECEKVLCKNHLFNCYHYHHNYQS